MNSVIKQLAPASPLLSLFLKMEGQIRSKSDANRTYEKLYPIMEELLMKGYRFESEEIQAIVGLLNELPAWGARRLNFQKYYLRDEYTLRKLPRNPNDIPSGMWH